MSPLSLLRAALTVQVLLGLARFLAPYAGLSIGPRIWIVHPVLGVTIALAALWLFRPRSDVPATSVRAAGQFIAFAPLLFGLANLLNLASGVVLVVVHMALGLAAIKVIDMAAEQQRAAERSAVVVVSSSH